MASNSKLTIAVAQVHTQKDLSSTLTLLRSTTQKAASANTAILLFPEAFLGGYPRTCSFGAAVGSRAPEGREQFLQYYKASVDLGDSAQGEGDRWVQRRLEVSKETGYRGDGTREFLEEVARETGVFIVTGCVERAGGSLYCTALFVDPKDGVVGKRRKVQPTGSERLVWSQGQPSSLKAIATTIKGVRVVMGCAICWENYMPLLRYALYAQGVNLWLAPTADPRATWEPLMKTVGCEGRCWVVSGNQCMKNRDLPEWITGKKSAGQRSEAGAGRKQSMTARTEENHEIAWKPKDGAEITKTIPENALEVDDDDADGDEFVSRGGSMIVSPMGETVAGPLWDKDEDILYAEIDFDDCARGKLDFDASGHYARLDAFKLSVEGLDLVPPP